MPDAAVVFTGQGTKRVPIADVSESYKGTISDNGKRHGQGVYKFPNTCFQYHGE